MTKQEKRWTLAFAAVAAIFVLAIATYDWQRPSGPTGPNAASTVRTLNITEVTYQATYPKIGYAPNLAVLGSDVPDIAQCRPRPEHACLVEATLACPTGVGTAWCVEGVYRYNIRSSSAEAPYKDYWITATPVQANPEFKNYCSGPDAVVRYEGGSPLSQPYSTLEECLAMEPVSKF
jgi:hypothetical protein